MSRTRGKKGCLDGPGDLSGQLWHYGGESAYREYDAGGGFFSRLFRRRARTRNERDRDKFSQFMSAGGMRHAERAEAERPRDQRALVVRWLVILAAVWTIFRFVSL